MPKRNILEREPFSIQTSAQVALKGHVLYPQGLRVTPLGERPCIVLVHQWSKLGGKEGLMDELANGFSRKGITSITFNLRGVGESTGSATWTGHNEVHDVASIVEYVRKVLGASKIFLLGSSAGAPVAGSAVNCSDAVKGYIGIGYPFGWWASILFKKHYKIIVDCNKPKLMITGTSDGFTSEATFESYFARMKEPKRKVLVKGVGHFELEGPGYDAFVVNETVRFIEEFSTSIAE